MTGAPPSAAPDDPRIETLLELLGTDPAAPTTVTDPGRARATHIADSRSGLEIPALAAATRIADIGSGAGFPGLVLAEALGAAQVDLIESSSRKCRFLGRAVAVMGLDNATVVCDRAETWGLSGAPGSSAYDAATARAVGRLASIAELASPLLRDGGTLVCWKGRRDREEERELVRAERALAMELTETRAVTPYPGSRDRHLHVIVKRGPTPETLPRRPGMAAKRPPTILPPPGARDWKPGISDGNRLRDRKSEGRRRQDHDRRQPRRVGGSQRSTDTAGRPRPAVQRDDRAERAPRGGDQLLHLPER